MVIGWRILFAGLSSLCCVSAVAARAIPIWHEIDVSAESSVLLCAFEEAEFIRSEIGRWLPNRLLPLSGATEPDVVWGVEYMRWSAEEKKCTVSLIVGNRATGHLEVMRWRWTPDRPDPTITATIEDLPSGVAVVLKEVEEDTTRRIWIQGFASAAEAEAQVSVSRANIMWDWKVRGWDFEIPGRAFRLTDAAARE